MPFKKRNSGNKVAALREQFTELTGASAEEAADFLSASNGDLSLAVNLFFKSNEDLQSASAAGKQSNTVASKTSTPKVSTVKGRIKAVVGKMGKAVKKMVAASTGKMSVRGQARRPAKEQHSSGQSSELLSTPSSSLSRSKQSATEDDSSLSPLRAPDQPKKEVLVRDTPSFAARQGQIRRLKKQQGQHRASLSPDGHRPLESSFGGGGGPSSVSAEQQQPKESHQQFFDRLFRPPLELLFETEEHENIFEAGKKAAVEQSKWLLLNLQRCSHQQFASLTLNRDLWADRSVQALVKAQFILLQLEVEEEEAGERHGESAGLGQQLAGFYQVTETPFVALLDPRTGEKMVSWSAGSEQLASAGKWLKSVGNFLDAQERLKSRKKEEEKVVVIKNNSTTTATAKNVHDVMAMSEEEQLKAAIEASLSEQQNQPGVKKAAATGPTSTSISSSSSWKQYLGPEKSGKQSLQFVIRLPDGTRRQVAFPADSKVKALQLYLEEELGLKENSYELVALLPKKCIILGGGAANLELTGKEVTLEAAGFKHRDTFYLQMK